ncbi:MAG: YggT family protein [Methylovulum sp.]|uniref:YggT family protein n=1 Tax=Methylovulum sp. TaxID=1916980 RepID=UPI00262DD9F3|nr:YggT family protein [Methylovulum sp.]MDD2722701.1 YggT family protein [Methylovulum sp.]MDD5124240.1 YggT family protein [Methylovulum sp.]
MDSSYLTDPIILIVDSLSSLYILAVLLRFLLQWCGTSFYNPIAQLLLKITHPPLRVLRRFIPPIGRIDTSSLVLVLFLQMLANFTILILKGVSVNIGALTILSIADVVALLINIFIFAVFARAILSWINPGAYDSASSILASLTEPLLNLSRKAIPDLGGIDLSPLAVLLFLQLAKMIILPPLQQLASLIG